MTEPKPTESSSPLDGHLRALGGLPRFSPDPTLAERHRREAEAAFVRAAGRSPGRDAVGVVLPLVLAGCVGVYVSWAFAAAWSLMF